MLLGSHRSLTPPIVGDSVWARGVGAVSAGAGPSGLEKRLSRRALNSDAIQRARSRLTYFAAISRADANAV